MSDFSTKDRKFAIEMGVSIVELEKLIGMPWKKFRKSCTKDKYGEEGMNKLKDFRKRFRNKVAARNCRKRQDDFIKDLQKQICKEEEKIEYLKLTKNKLHTEKQNLESQLNQLLAEGRAEGLSLICVRGCPQLMVECFEEDHVLHVP
jgi:hypothetical protein